MQSPSDCNNLINLDNSNSSNNFRLLKQIGKGNDASVYNCEYNGKLRAAKVYDLTEKSLLSFSGALREITFLKNVKHKNIIKLIDVIADKNYSQIILVLENCDKSLKIGRAHV